MRKLVVTPVLALALAGCGTIPTQLAQSSVTPSEINNAVRCEVAYALDSGAGDIGYFSNWNAGIVLVTKLIDHTSAKPGVTFSAKVNDVEWKSPAGIDYSDKRTGEMKITYKITSLSSAKSAACPKRGSSLAATGLGLADWLEGAGKTLTPKTSGGGEINTLKYLIEFSVERSVGGGLTFKTEHLDFGLNANSISRTSDNTLTIEFDAPPSGPKVKGAPARGRSAEQLTQDILKEQDEPKVLQVEPGQLLVIPAQ